MNTDKTLRVKKNVQDVFLKKMIKEKKKVYIYLENGIKIVGIIKDFDNFTISVPKDGEEQIIYKSAISTIRSVTEETYDFSNE